MKTKPREEKIRKLFTKQRFAVLATQNGNEPYTSLVAFSTKEDLSQIIFATLRQTRKYTNILHNPKVALLIDNRENLSSDVSKACAVTISGIASEIKDNNHFFIDLYLKKHPYLSDFVHNKNCALIAVSVENLHLVQQFQKKKRHQKRN